MSTITPVVRTRVTKIVTIPCPRCSSLIAREAAVMESGEDFHLTWLGFVDQRDRHTCPIHEPDPGPSWEDGTYRVDGLLSERRGGIWMVYGATGVTHYGTDAEFHRARAAAQIVRLEAVQP